MVGSKGGPYRICIHGLAGGGLAAVPVEGAQCTSILMKWRDVSDGCMMALEGGGGGCGTKVMSESLAVRAGKIEWTEPCLIVFSHSHTKILVKPPTVSARSAHNKKLSNGLLLQGKQSYSPSDSIRPLGTLSQAKPFRSPAPSSSLPSSWYEMGMHRYIPPTAVVLRSMSIHQTQIAA